MNNFQVIYKILRLLDKNKGREDFDYALISAKAMGITHERWEQLCIMLQKNNLVRGLVYDQTMSDKFPHLVEPIRPTITLKGMEYLNENSLMSKAKEALRMVGDIL